MLGTGSVALAGPQPVNHSHKSHTYRMNAAVSLGNPDCHRAHIYNARAWEVTAGRSEVQSYPQLHTEFEASLGYTRASQNIEGWREGAVVKSTCCSHRGPRFHSQWCSGFHHTQRLATAYNSQSKGSDVLFCLPSAPGMQMVYMCTHIHISRHS